MCPRWLRSPPIRNLAFSALAQDFSRLAERIERPIAVLRITHRRPFAAVARAVFREGCSSCLCFILRRNLCEAGTGYAGVCLR